MKQAWRAFIATVATAGVLACAVAATAQSVGGELERGFKDPPEAARPRPWWHWTAGNVTLEGVTKDLEWMKRAGLARGARRDTRGARRGERRRLELQNARQPARRAALPRRPRADVRFP